MTIADPTRVSPAVTTKLNWREWPQDKRLAMLERLRAIPTHYDYELEKSSLENFAQHVLPFYQAEPAHLLIARTLDRVLSGDIKRLMVFSPPQSGKSLLVSTLFPAYWLAKRPDDPLILTSYGGSLAEFHSRNSRLIIESDEFHQLFPLIDTDPQSRARSQWSLVPPNRGKLLAVGVGGPVTGHGSRCMSANTSIATEVGDIAIEKLAELDTKPRIWAYDEEKHHPVLAELLAVQKSHRSDMLRVTTYNKRSIDVTSDHQFYVSGYGYLPADDLRPEDGLFALTFASSPYCMLDAVVQVENIYPDGADVYDLQIAKYANFFANKVLVHNCAIIDDPYENWEQAQTRSERERVWDWYRGTFRPRVWENGAIIIVTTRWHPDDLAGRLLFDQADHWTILRLPAIAETQEERDFSNVSMGLPKGLPDPLFREAGQALTPKRFSLAALNGIKRDVGSMVWGAEYQGAPRLPEGNLIKREWLTDIVTSIPPYMRMVRYWDKAGSEGKGDYTAGVLIGEVREGGHWIVLDVVRGQWSALGRDRVIRETAEKDGRSVQIWLEQESGSGGKESAEASIRNLAGFNVHTEPATGSKVVRANPFIAQLEAMNVSLLRAPWNSDFIDELISFPFGVNDDQIDAVGSGFLKLSQRTGAVAHMF